MTLYLKNTLLKAVVNLNYIPHIKLILSLYKMNSNNAPKIEHVLIKNIIAFMSEAHYYLVINGERSDLTSSDSDFNIIKNKV
jgi:hypothetical protein